MNPFDVNSLDNLLKGDSASNKVLSRNEIPFNDLNTTEKLDEIFTKVKVENRALHNRKSSPIKRILTKLAISNNIAFVGTSDGAILRFNLEGNGEIEEIEISRKLDDMVDRLFVDPSGNHCVVSLKNNEVFYVSNKSLRPKKLSKFQGQLACVAFDRSSTVDNTLKPFLVGTSSGKIYEVMVDINGREKFNLLVFQIDTLTSIYSLQFINLSTENGSESQIFLFFATSNPIRLYHFLGCSTIQKLFSDSLASGQSYFTEIPGEKIHRIDIQYHGRSLEKNVSFNILTKIGIYQGSILFNDSALSSEHLTVEAQLFPFPSNSPLPNLTDPIDVLSTSYHFLALRKDKIHIISRLSGEIIQEILINKDIEGYPVAISKDFQKDTIWLLSDLYLFKVIVINEDRFVWSIYLKKALNGDEKCFELALQHAKSKDQRAEIIRVQAQSYLSHQQYEKAALNFAKVDISFDEAVLSLLQCHTFDVVSSTQVKNFNFKHMKKGLIALRIYLSEIIKRLSPLSKSQLTMLSTWLAEIILNEVSELNLFVERLTDNQIHFKADLAQIFKELLRSQKSLLDSSTIFNLITSRNDRMLFLFYSQIIGDYDRVIGYYLNDSRYIDLVQVLTDAPFEKVEYIIYRMSPILIEFEPESTVDMLLSKHRLKITLLIPTILRYCAVLDQQSTMKELPDNVNKVGYDFNGRKVNYVIRFLFEYISIIESDYSYGPVDCSAYHTLSWLLAKYDDDDEKESIKFLESIINKTKHGMFPVAIDKEYLLREFKRQKRYRSVALTFLMLQMEEEAVKTLISFDINYAQSIAIDCVNPTMKKKLWLIIAKHLMESESDVKKTTVILSDSKGVLQIEDLLPYLPDFAEIDLFKDEICRSLEISGSKIETLKIEMTELSESAENISQELDGIKKRGYNVSTYQRCDFCNEALFNKLFYMFPCTHGFHGDCLSKRVIKYLDSSQVSNLRNIEDQLKQLAARGKDSDRKSSSLQEYLQNELDGYISADCPLCGIQMIQNLITPLISDQDELEAKSWDI